MREFGGESIDYAARVSESPWAVVHFTVLLPDGVGGGAVDTSEGNRARVEDLLTEATRTWADRLLGSVHHRGLSSRRRRALRRCAARGVQAGGQAVRGDRRHRHHRRPATGFGPIADGTRRREDLRRGVSTHLVPRRRLGIAEHTASDAAMHGGPGPRGAAVPGDPP